MRHPHAQARSSAEARTTATVVRDRLDELVPVALSLVLDILGIFIADVLATGSDTGSGEQGPKGTGGTADLPVLQQAGHDGIVAGTQHGEQRQGSRDRHPLDGRGHGSPPSANDAQVVER